MDASILESPNIRYGTFDNFTWTDKDPNPLYGSWEYDENLTAKFKQGLSELRFDIDNAVGEYEYSRGALPPRKETATGIVRLQQAASVRFDTVVKMLEFTVIRNIAKMFYGWIINLCLNLCLEAF
jgi:hypothetical protein